MPKSSLVLPGFAFTSLALALPAQTLDDLRDQLRDAARGSRYSLFAAGCSMAEATRWRIWPGESGVQVADSPGYWGLQVAVSDVL